MKKKKSAGQNLSEREVRLIQQLRERPAMMERVQSILEIADNAEGPLKTADEVEGLLIEEMRRLGNSTMKHWATQAEERIGSELQEQDPTVLSRKKNAEMVVRLWIGGDRRADLVQPPAELPASGAGSIGSHCSRPIPTIGTGLNRLWL